MLRRLALFVARQSWVRKFVMSTPVLSDIAWRFVGGEDLASGLEAVRALNAKGIKGTLNFLGMHVRDEREAMAAADQAIESLQRIHDQGIDSHVSVKLTKIGLDVDTALCRTQLVRILDRAAATGNFVRIDMEESVYVDQTIQLFEEMLAQYGQATVGLVLQSYLRARHDDIKRLVARGASIRLTKGGYREPSDVVYRARAEINEAFKRDIGILLREGKSPAIATHDSDAIAWTVHLQKELGLRQDAFEFQMLYGVRPDIQARLVREGYTLRCYVTYGQDWAAHVIGCLRRIPLGAIGRLWKHPIFNR